MWMDQNKTEQNNRRTYTLKYTTHVITKYWFTVSCKSLCVSWLDFFSWMKYSKQWDINSQMNNKQNSFECLALTILRMLSSINYTLHCFVSSFCFGFVHLFWIEIKGENNRFFLMKTLIVFVRILDMKSLFLCPFSCDYRMCSFKTQIKKEVITRTSPHFNKSNQEMRGEREREREHTLS
jgi:hypothetical protein